jgi:glycosyltransferase involved in cell wall biosynthesis
MTNPNAGQPANAQARDGQRLAVSVIMPVMDETVSLRETVQIVMDEAGEDVHEMICVVSKYTSKESLAVCEELAAKWPGVVLVRQQEKPYLGGALQDAFSWATGSHILLMASDLETPPHDAKLMIAEARKGWDIVATTRWTGGGGFRGYNPVKYVCNWIFQKAIGALYRTRLTDLTYGYRIWRTELLRGHDWEELRHPFLLECLLRPLLRGATATEIPVFWEPRKEGESHNPFWRNFLYFRIAWKLRFGAQAKAPVAARGELA